MNQRLKNLMTIGSLSRYFYPIISIVFGTTIVVLAVLLVNSNNSQNQASIYPLIDPARHLTNQEHFFSTINPLREELRVIVEKYEAEGHRIGLYFEYLNTGSNIAINQDSRFWPASLSKMPTALAAMRKVQDGEWKLSNELVLFFEDRDDRFGTLYQKPAGTQLTIEALLKELLINSDNTAHKILVRNLEASDYTEILEALGMEELYNDNYDITAKEYSRIFRALYSASYLNREYSQLLLKWLSETPFAEFLNAGVPSSTLFSHKIGEEYKEVVFLDSGIVYVPNRPYLITVMIEVENNETDEKAKQIMREISKASYKFVVNE